MRRTITALTAMCSIGALTPATPAAATPVPAVSIVLERSGGFTGSQDTFVVDRTAVGGRRPLRMVASPEFRRLRGAYQPSNACCDRYLYRIAVTYRDGRRKAVSTVQGTPAPRILWDVIAEVQRVAARPSAPVPA